MVRDARGFRDQADQVVAPIHGLDGAEAELLQSRFGEDGADQGLEFWRAGAPAPLGLANTAGVDRRRYTG